MGHSKAVPYSLGRLNKVLAKLRKNPYKFLTTPMRPPGHQVYQFGPFRLDPAEHQLFRSGTPVRLTPKAFETLRVLVEHSGHLVERDALLQAVWPNTVVEDGGLTRNISVLRTVLSGRSQPNLIETAPTRGYRFVAAVRMTPHAGRVLATTQAPLGHINPTAAKTDSPLKSIAVLPFKLIGKNDAEYLGLGMQYTLITKL